MGVSDYLTIKNATFVAIYVSFTSTTIDPPFADQKTITEQTTGSTKKY